MNIEQEYKTELARQIAGLKSKFTVKQLAMADYLYVYALDCDDEKAERYPACKAMLEAEGRLYEIDPDAIADDDLRKGLGLPESKADLFEMFELGRDFEI